MRKKTMILLTVLLAALGLYCGWRYYRDVWRPNRQIIDALAAQNALFFQHKPNLDRAARVSTLPESSSGAVPDGTEAVSTEPWVDPLAELKAFNPDTVGWITIEGTTVDYPIVQAADNQSYLKTGFDRLYSYVGCPFLDASCDGFRGFNAIVYAHHILGKQEMFADVAQYKDSDFLLQHPTGTLLTADGIHSVEFFAYLTVSSTADVYHTVFASKEEQDAYLETLFASARYTRGQSLESLQQSQTLHLLLLSTCTYEYQNARGVLVGVIR